MGLNALGQGIEIWPALSPVQIKSVYRRQMVLKTEPGAKAMHDAVTLGVAEATKSVLELNVNQLGKQYLRANPQTWGKAQAFNDALMAHFGTTPYYKSKDNTITNSYCTAMEDVRCRKWGNVLTLLQADTGMLCKACKRTRQEQKAYGTLTEHFHFRHYDGTVIARAGAPFGRCGGVVSIHDALLWQVCKQCASVSLQVTQEEMWGPPVIIVDSRVL